MEDLKQLFRKIGDVRDVFCPKKRDKGGSMFGFVRFPMEYNEIEVLDKLNTLWIRSFKLRAWIPKFSRVPMLQKTSRLRIFPERLGLRRGNKYFVETLKSDNDSSEGESETKV